MKNMKNVKLDKQSGATIILAVIVAFFMGAMFLVNNSVGRSYALPSTGTSIPENLVTHLESMSSDTQLWTVIDAMTAAAGLQADSTLFNAPNSRISDGNGYNLYCLDRALQVAELTFSKGEVANTNYKVILYILENNYKESAVTTNEEYYTTQHAIWYYLASVGIDKSDTATSYKTAIDTAAVAGNETAIKIINKVSQAKTQSVAANWLNVHGLDELTLTKSSDGNYLESSDLRVEATANNISKFKYYTVTTGDSSIEVVRVTTDGYENVTNTTQLQNGNSFKIKIPIDKEDEIESLVANIKVAGYFDEQTLYYYLPPTDYADSVQKVLYVNSTTRTVPSEVNLNFVKISKQDVTNGKELPGATLKLEKNWSGTYSKVTEWVSSESPRYVYLEPGDYRLTETIAPSGYELSTETIEFTVTDDNKPTQVVVMKNTPYVDTPDTAEGLPVYVYIIGTIILVIGTTMVYTSVKTRKN